MENYTLANTSNPFQGEIVEKDYSIELQGSQKMFCSMVANTPEEKAKLFTAMNNSDERLADQINKVLLIKDIYCETVKCVNKDTGEINLCPRIVLIDVNGVSYQSVSQGVFSGLKKLIAIFGMPTWAEGLPIEIKQVTSGVNKILTFNVVFDRPKGKK